MRKDELSGAAAWERLEREGELRKTLSGRISLAESGDEDSALWVLRLARFHLGRCADQSGSLPPEIAEYLELALGKILRREDPACAFGLKLKKGQSPPLDYWKLARDADMARGVNFWRQDEHKTLDEAIDAIASNYNGFKNAGSAHGFESVKKAYQRFFPSKKDKGKR